MIVLYYLEDNKVKRIIKKDGERQSDVQDFKNKHKDKDLLYYDLVNEKLLDLNNYEDGLGVSGIVMPNGDYIHVRYHRHKVFAWCYEELELDDNLLFLSSKCQGKNDGMSHISITKDIDLTKEQKNFLIKYRSKFDEMQIYSLMTAEKFGFYPRDIV